jgi:membrane protein YdbS with pleckstrin-like domain
MVDIDKKIISSQALAALMASEEETVVYRFGPCFWRMIFGSFTGLGILILLLLPVVMIPKIPGLPPLHGAQFLPLIILPIWWIKYATTKYILTNQRLTLRWGILIRSKDDVELYRITDVKTHISLINHVAGIGSVTATAAESEGGRQRMVPLKLDNIQNPESMHDLLRNLTESVRKKRGVRDTFIHG